MPLAERGGGVAPPELVANVVEDRAEPVEEDRGDDQDHGAGRPDDDPAPRQGGRRPGPRAIRALMDRGGERTVGAMEPITLVDGTWTAQCYINNMRCPSLWKAEYLPSREAAEKELVVHYRQRHPEFVKRAQG